MRSAPSEGLSRVPGHGVGSWKLLLGPLHFGLGIKRAEEIWGNHVPAATHRCQARGEGGEASSRPNQPCDPISLPGETKESIWSLLHFSQPTTHRDIPVRPYRWLTASLFSLRATVAVLWWFLSGVSSVLGLMSCFSQSIALELS